MGAVLAFPLERRFNDLGERLGDYRGLADVVILPVIHRRYCDKPEAFVQPNAKNAPVCQPDGQHPTKRRRNYEPSGKATSAAPGAPASRKAPPVR